MVFVNGVATVFRTSPLAGVCGVRLGADASPSVTKNSLPFPDWPALRWWTSSTRATS